MSDTISCEACGHTMAQPTPFCSECGARLVITASPEIAPEHEWQPNPEDPNDLAATHLKARPASPADTARFPTPDSAPSGSGLWVVIAVVVVGVVIAILAATGML